MFETALVAQSQPQPPKRDTLETIDMLLKIGTSAVVFGAYVAVLGGGVYVGYRLLKRLRLIK